MSVNWKSPRYVETNGIRMALYEQGNGVPVIMCHGFPELAYAWRHQIPAIAAAGFRAINRSGIHLAVAQTAVLKYSAAWCERSASGWSAPTRCPSATMCSG